MKLKSTGLINNSILTYPAVKYRKYIKSSNRVINNRYVREMHIASDTEYVSNPNQRNQMITTQLAFDKEENNCVVLEHPKLGKNKLPTWNTKFILNSILGFEEIDYERERDGEIICPGYLLVKIKFYFAPADVLAGLFNDDFLLKTVQRNCKQDARLNINSGLKYANNLLFLDLYVKNELGETNQIIIEFQDLSQVCGKEPLKGTAASLGIKMRAKNTMDDYKSNMLEPYLDEELHEEFVKYSKEDACVLFEIEEKIKQRNKQLFEVHGLEAPDKQFYTSGALVSTIKKSYIEKIIGSNKAYELHNYDKKKMTLSQMLSHTTISGLAEEKGNLAANALVQGGRAKNEQPLTFKREGVIADADFSSCYVSIQRQLVYPVGIPNTYQRPKSAKKTQYTLGEFLKKYKDDLESRTYQIVVSGELNHNQSLVPSKDATIIKINSSYSEDSPKIEAPFRLFQKEVINGVITSDVLEHLKWTCSNQELSNWMKLEVVTAIWYPASKRCNSPEEWLEKTQQYIKEVGCNEEVPVDNKNGTIHYEDRRSKYWLAIPIENFLKPYADERSRLKKERNKYKKGTDEYLFYDAQQTTMKLVGNTLYGVFASPYFDIGNVVVANNITAIARCAVWGLNAAAGTFQSITDGGAYDLNNVNYWDKTQPSMNVITQQSRKYLLSKDTKNIIKQKKLFDKELEITYNPNTQKTELKGEGIFIEGSREQWHKIDEALEKHIKHFFRGEKGKNTPSLWNFVSIAHKDMFKEIVTHAQANYRLLQSNEELFHRARGNKTEGTPYNNETEEANIKKLFADLSKNPNKIPPYNKQSIGQILKVNQANEKLQSKTANEVQCYDLRAGDSIEVTKQIRPISLSMFHWLTKSQYDNWERNNNKQKKKSGWGVEQFFLDDNQNLDYQKAINTIQEKIDNGDSWIVKNAKVRNPKIHPSKSQK